MQDLRGRRSTNVFSWRLSHANTCSLTCRRTRSDRRASGQRAEKLRTQQRQKKNKAHKQMRPYSEPKKFGGLCTMDHCFAANDLSRGLYGKTSRVTLRARYIGILASPSTRDKSVEHV
eukprot:6611566-Pyramimonas_sp.AAC.1